MGGGGARKIGALDERRTGVRKTGAPLGRP